MKVKTDQVAVAPVTLKDVAAFVAELQRAGVDVKVELALNLRTPTPVFQADVKLAEVRDILTDAQSLPRNPDDVL